MNNYLLSLLFLLCSSSLFAQNGSFNVSRSGTVLNLTGSDPSGKYATITLHFDKTVSENDAVTFYDGNGMFPLPGITATLYKLTNDSTMVIALSLDEKNYVVSGTSGPPIPEQFRLSVGSAMTSVPLNLKQVPAVASQAVANYYKGTFDNNYEPGYLLYDAIFISDSMRTSKGADSTILAVLRYYGISSLEELAQNQYLKNELGYLYPMVQGNFSIESLTGTSLSGLLSSVGDLDVTTLADGLAKFIVARTKQELNIAFFDHLKETMNDPDYIDLRTVFPQTYRVLSVIGDEIYQYDLYLQALREAFEKDLGNLPVNLSTIIANHPAFFTQHKELKAALQSAFYITRGIRDEQHPGNIIADYPATEYLTDNGIDSNVTAAFQTMQLLSVSLRSNALASERYWAPEPDMRKLFTSDLTFRMYMGLLEQAAKQQAITFRQGGGAQVPLSEIIDDAYAYYTEYRSYIKTTAANLQTLENDIKAMKGMTDDSLKLESYYGIITASIDLMEQLTTVEDLPDFPVKGIRQETAKYFHAAQTTANLAIEVYRKNYAMAIIDAVHLYDSVFSKKNIAAAQRSGDVSALLPAAPKTAGSASPVAAAGKKNTADTDEAVEKEAAKYDATSDLLLKYGSFMAAIARAKTSDDVEAAIEAAALPVGSARIKRESAFNIALNAYCGPYVGYERIKGLDPAWCSRKNTFANSIGLTVPVGISISWGGNCPKADNHSSYSIFLSAIDIGALAAFRFNDDTTSVLPTIQLKNILSPGVFFSYGIPKCPVSVNLGWQMGPLLREVDPEVDENTYKQHYGRLSLSVCVDIPVVNFYTLPRKGL